ncbi:acyltransferase [Streptomyces sp. NPDC097619]|uniref:acyltransferase family protein n=1 Tax=Streptomyces sp. NPDC097619 TaxID=3157228 RepID=UPI00331D243A
MTSLPPGRTVVPHRSHIAPLDGLRGIAVLGVLLFHADRFPGGFLGVDLFFVLSGFLITGLLLREAETRGTVDLAAFWGRRARRLLPALLATVAGTLLLAAFLGTAAQFRLARADAPWVLANLANWHFIAGRDGYWNTDGTRLFAHLWSIAVEEQFYLFWPPALLLLWRLGRTARIRARALAATAAGGILLSAVAMAVLLDPVDSTRVHEGTDTRAFALLLGALAATPTVRRRTARLGTRTTTVLSGALVLALGAGWALASGTGAGSAVLFRGGLLLHSAACAALVALLAHAPGTAPGRLLAAPPLRFLGGISYGLYLWHWPVFLLLDTALPQPAGPWEGWPRAALFILVSVAVAVVSKACVEDPVRYRARWAHGRTGALALGAAVLAVLALWWLLPAAVPVPGGPAVDVTRLAVGAAAP